MLALALIGGSTAAVLNYLSSRSANAAERAVAERAAAELAAAERALLDQVPPGLRKSCTRNADAERDTANVEAAMTCTSDGDTNEVVFTKFTSPKALDDRYNADVVTAVATAGVVQNSGDCRSAERGEGEYASKSSRTRGRALCYPLRGSSVIEWTEGGSQTLGVATWADPDHTKLAVWWAGVVDVELPAPKPTQAPAQPPVVRAPVTPAPVTPKPPNRITTKYIFDPAGRLCLSSNKENKVYIMECDDGSRPNWDILDNDTIRDKQTGRCLSGSREGEVYTAECNNDDYQKWNDIEGTLQNIQIGRCLSRNEADNVSIAKCNNEDYQKWEYGDKQ